MLRFLIVVSFIKFPVPTMIFHWKSSMHSTATKVVYVTCNRSTYIFHLTGEVEILVNLGLKLWRSIIIANFLFCQIILTQHSVLSNQSHIIEFIHPLIPNTLPLGGGKSVNSLIIFGASWTLWKQQNACVFDGDSPSVLTSMRNSKLEEHLWVLARATNLQNLELGRLGL